MTRVVVIDDDDDVRETTVMLLQVLGFKALGYEGPAQAERALAGTDVLLQDVHIPGMVLSEQLTRVAGLPRPPGVVLFSATVDVRELEGLPGVCAVLSKPFTAAQLERAIADATTPAA